MRFAPFTYRSARRRGSAHRRSAQFRSVVSVLMVAALAMVSIAITSPANAQDQLLPVNGTLLAGDAPLAGVTVTTASTTGATNAQGGFSYQELAGVAGDVKFSTQEQTADVPRFDIAVNVDPQQCPDDYAYDANLSMCANFEDAQQGPPTCPDGALGEPDGCYILVATGPASAPTCAVGELAPGGGFCILEGPEPEPGPDQCPTGPTVFGDVDNCYTIVAPCGVDETFVDGVCQRPVDLVPGASLCSQGFGLVDDSCVRYEQTTNDMAACPRGSLEDRDGNCRQPVATEPGVPCPAGSLGEPDGCYILVDRGPAGEPMCEAGVLSGDLCVITGPGPVTGPDECPTSSTVFGDVDNCYTIVAPCGDGETFVDGVCQRPVDLITGLLECEAGFNLITETTPKCVQILPVTPGSFSCPEGSVEDDAGDCRKPVANQDGALFCENSDAALNDTSCVLTAMFEPITVGLPEIQQLNVTIENSCFELSAINVVCDEYTVAVNGDFTGTEITGVTDGFPGNGGWSAFAATSGGQVSLPVFAVGEAEIMVQDQALNVVAEFVWDGSSLSVVVPVELEEFPAELELRFDVVRENGEECPASFDDATPDVGQTLEVEDDEELTYCFAVKNLGPGDAFNVTATYLDREINLAGLLPAGETAQGSFDAFVGANTGVVVATASAVDETSALVTADDTASVELVNPPAPIAVFAGDYVINEQNGTFDVIVSIDAGDMPVGGIEFGLVYDPTLVAPVLVSDDGALMTPDCSSLVGGAVILACGPPNPTGEVRVAMASTSALPGGEALVSIPFTALANNTSGSLDIVDLIVVDVGGFPYTDLVTIDGSFTTAWPELTCLGKPVTIDMRDGSSGIGTPGDDVIYGTSGRDFINGRGGNDTICARGGNDFIRGGAGDDLIHAGGGNDRVFGDRGDDDIRGSSGNDVIFGGRGNDIVRAGSGNDYVRGSSGADDLRGGNGNDRVFGGSGSDVLRGQNGNDSLFGGSGNDDLYGGAGFDRCNGSSGSDKVRCEIVRGRSER